MSRLSRVGLARRLYLAAPSWSLVVGLLVLLTSALLVAAPRVSAAAAGTELRQAIDDVQGSDRDLTAAVSGGFHPGAGSAPDLDPVAAEEFGALDDQLRALAESADPALRERMGEVDYVARSGILSASAAGMRVVAIPNKRFPPDEEALAAADVIIPSINELTPDAVEES